MRRPRIYRLVLIVVVSVILHSHINHFDHREDWSDLLESGYPAGYRFQSLPYLVKEKSNQIFIFYNLDIVYYGSLFEIRFEAGHILYKTCV